MQGTELIVSNLRRKRYIQGVNGLRTALKTKETHSTLHFQKTHKVTPQNQVIKGALFLLKSGLHWCQDCMRIKVLSQSGSHHCSQFQTIPHLLQSMSTEWMQGVLPSKTHRAGAWDLCWYCCRKTESSRHSRPSLVWPPPNLRFPNLMLVHLLGQIQITPRTRAAVGSEMWFSDSSIYSTGRHTTTKMELSNKPA